MGIDGCYDCKGFVCMDTSWARGRLVSRRQDLHQFCCVIVYLNHCLGSLIPAAVVSTPRAAPCIFCRPALNPIESVLITSTFLEPAPNAPAEETLPIA